MIKGKKRENTNYEARIYRSVSTGNYIDIKRIVRKYNKLYAKKFDNSLGMNKFLERHSYPRLL